MATAEVPGRKDRAKQQGANFVFGLKQSRVKQVFINGMHLAVVNTIGAFTSEFLNFYLESRGLNQRRIALLSVPNPDKDTPQNPLKRKVP